MMTVSAAVRLMPRPPALVQSRKTNRSESGTRKKGGVEGKGRWEGEERMVSGMARQIERMKNGRKEDEKYGKERYRGRG